MAEAQVEEVEEEECPKCPPKGAPACMATFADMATLLMAFFVLILSFAEFNVPKFKQISGSLKEAFGVQKVVPVVEQPKGTTVIELNFSPNPDPSISTTLRQDTTELQKPELELKTETEKSPEGTGDEKKSQSDFEGAGGEGEEQLDAQELAKDEQDNARRCLYFPQVLLDARRIDQYHAGLDPTTPQCMDRLGVSLADCESKCQNFYDAAEVERVFYPEIENLLLQFFPDASDALVYNHDVFDKDYAGDRTEDQENKNPGVNANYANLVHNDLNDNSGRVRCRELLTKNLRNFGRPQNFTEEEADRKMSRRFMSINLAKPMETEEQNPFVLCAWPSFADQPYINNYRVYDDRVGETTRFTFRPEHEWYWVPQQKPDEVSMLKCYDSVTDGSVSRWSFHSACIDPTAPEYARCRKNVVVRSYVFF